MIFILEFLKKIFSLGATPGVENSAVPLSPEIPQETPREKLLRVIKQAYAFGLPNQKWVPSVLKDGTLVTHCNEAVNFICTSFGYNKFVGEMANQMISLMEKNEDWEPVTAKVAQDTANTGGIVVCAWANPAGHGHVCIVMPGNLSYSSSWGENAPTIMNIGKTNFIDKPASFAFTKAEFPTFFKLKTIQ